MELIGIGLVLIIVLMLSFFAEAIPDLFSQWAAKHFQRGPDGRYTRSQKVWLWSVGVVVAITAVVCAIYTIHELNNPPPPLGY